jgi:hypothetical protein
LPNCGFVLELLGQKFPIPPNLLTVSMMYVPKLMEVVDKWNRREIVVDENVVAFLEVFSNLNQYFFATLSPGSVIDVSSF